MEIPPLPPAPSPSARRPARLWTRLGGALVGLSLLLWVPLPVLPFLSMPGGQKAAVGGGLLVAAEVAFWVGAALMGPEAARRFRSWRGRRAERTSDALDGPSD